MAKLSLMERIRKERAELEARKTQFGDAVKWFKPKDGDSHIRILPNMKNAEELPYHKFLVHFVKKTGKVFTLVCPKSDDVEADCPLCAAHEELKKAGNKDLSKEFRPQERYVYNVVDFATKEVLPWGVGQMLHGDILMYAEDSGEDNVFDIDSGRDWKITKSQEPGKSKQFGTKYKIRPFSKASALPDKLLAVAQEAASLDTIYKRQADDLEKMNEYLVNTLPDYTDKTTDDEDDAPVQRKVKPRVVEEDEDEAPVAVKRSVRKTVDEDEDDAPVTRSRKTTSDDEDEPRKVAKGSNVEADDDEDINKYLKAKGITTK